MMASRLHSALVSVASVATMAMVVAVAGAGWPLKRTASASGEIFCGQPRPPNSSPCS